MSKQQKKILIVGNWKMNPATMGLARKLFVDIRKGFARKRLTTEVAIAPPFPFIAELAKLSPSQRIKISAQDVFHEKVGPFTGEVSLSMLQSIGVSSVIIGHSERRAMGDTNEEIAQDVASALKSKVTTIVCVGEKQRDAQGHYFGEVEAQLQSVLRAVPKNKLTQLVIAYEPVWAIGTGKHATAEDVYEMKLFIVKILADTFGRNAEQKVRILYGGSVNAKNAKELMEVGQVNGFLIGGASLRAREFVSVINQVEAYAK